nr:hypothetical protein [uncultured Roseateles sp.]
MPAQFVYGRREGRLLHVRDLDPDVERRRQCDCLCPECLRPLQAHMGETRAWHFQHDVDDATCNPQPMTLLHAFVRDRLAEKRQLWLPGGQVQVTTEVLGHRWSERVDIPDRVYLFNAGIAESRTGDVQPDVVFTIPQKWDLALEVRKTHAVDAAKKARLQEAFRDAIEFDVSDLPAAGITDEELEQILRERHRWKWLSWTDHRWAEARLRDRVLWEQSDWKADIGFFARAMPYKPPAAAKLRQSQKRLAWAEQEFAKIKAANFPKLQRAAVLGSMELTDRIAVVCAAMGLEPERLPVYFAQRVQRSMERHPYAWQLPIFAAFGLGTKAFTSQDVVQWMAMALPDCVLAHPEERTRNGFSRTRAAAHNFLLQLEAQGLLRSDGNATQEARVFRPAFASRSDFLEFLAAQG